MNVLISGKDSQIGNRIEDWLNKCPDSSNYQVKQLDVITDAWKEYDFSHVDVVVHVAAIVHRPDCNDWNLYKKVNAVLPVEIACKAKAQGVKQFVFLSTMAVFGMGKKLNNKVIDKNTIPSPNSMYGRSKYLAEQELIKLDDDGFRITIVRPPNVYGGNRNDYVYKISKLVKYLPIIPLAYNNVKQSMIYIDNLTELIRLLIHECKAGIFMPQDPHAVSTVELVSSIKRALGQPVRKSSILGLFVRLFHFIPFVEKVYGGVMYSEEMSIIEGVNYNCHTLDQSLNQFLGRKLTTNTI